MNHYGYVEVLSWAEELYGSFEGFRVSELHRMGAGQTTLSVIIEEKFCV
jgi:hypothetical protein